MSQKKLSCEQLDYLVRLFNNDSEDGMCSDWLDYFKDGFVITKKNVDKLIQRIFNEYGEIGQADGCFDILDICRSFCDTPSDELQKLFRDYMYEYESYNILDEFIEDYDSCSVVSIVNSVIDAANKLKKDYDRFITLLTQFLKTINISKLNNSIQEMKAECEDYDDGDEEEGEEDDYKHIDDRLSKEETEMLIRISIQLGKDEVKKILSKL